MNLDIIRARNETEDSSLSNSKLCERLNEQTHTKPQETLKVELTQPKETFSLKPPISIGRSWMIGLTHLQVHIFLI